MAGTIVAASLVTGINSDLPGTVIAQVTEAVYGTVTGRHLLIPQGARLIGAYDSVVAFGQERALVVWRRIVMPDGSSVVIKNMPATDTAGYAGLEDEVDFHTWRLIKGIVLSTLFWRLFIKSTGLTVTSPRSAAVHKSNGAIPVAGFILRMRVDMLRISRGPSRAPGRFVVPPSKGTPINAISISVGRLTCGSRMNVAGLEYLGTSVPDTGRWRTECSVIGPRRIVCTGNQRVC
jgi:hypothetical protein